MDEFPVLPRMDAATRDADGADVWRPHVTVACVVPDRDRFLMVEESVRGEQLYNQPAGHLDRDETLLEAARRETLEETGWEVELEHFIGVQQWYSGVHDSHVVRFAFSARPVRHDPERSLDHGIVRALWLTYPEIVALGERVRSPLVLATLHDWQAGQRLTLNAIRSLLPARGA
jgi:8-oxo-dGTP pyrophosphatase MutT (NUDIX family)